MPIYCYTCRCGHNFEQVRPMADCSKPIQCPECLKPAERDIGAENGRTRVPKDACWPLRSDALGCNPEDVPAQRAELARHGLPGKVHSDGTIEVGSRKEYDTLMKAYKFDTLKCGSQSPRRRNRAR